MNNTLQLHQQAQLNLSSKNNSIISKEIFDSNGYLILPEFISFNECQQLIQEQENIINKYHNSNNYVVFETQTNEHIKNKYFLDSARKISLFYEQDAFDSNHNLVQPLHKSINKIGHALHDLNPIFKKFSYQIKFKKLLIDLGLTKPKIVQSMYLSKQPKIGNKVDLHQDSTFIFTEPESCIGLWFALEDADQNNGCLWAIPKSHELNLNQRMLCKGEEISIENMSEQEFNLSEAIPLEVKAGSLIVLHGRLAHYSNYNHSNKSRHAYSLHCVDNVCAYSSDNWLQDNELKFQDWD